MLNIVVPMAGRGQRFAEAGYSVPKPLIPIHGQPMTRVVIGNLRPTRLHRFIFLILREHAEKHGLDALLTHAVILDAAIRLYWALVLCIGTKY